MVNIVRKPMLSVVRATAILLCALAAGSVVASDDVTRAVSVIQENFDRIRTISCNLAVTSKVKYQTNGTGAFETSKTMRYLLKRPDKISAERADGTVEISNGERHWWISVGTDPVELPLTQSPTASFALPPTYLWNMADLRDKLVVSAAGPSEGAQVLEAQVNGTVNATLRAFHIDPATGMVIKVILHDASGEAYQETALEYEERSGIYVPVRVVEHYAGSVNEMTRVFAYEDVRINEDIPDSMFQP